MKPEESRVSKRNEWLVKYGMESCPWIHNKVADDLVDRVSVEWWETTNWRVRKVAEKLRYVDSCWRQGFQRVCLGK